MVTGPAKSWNTTDGTPTLTGKQNKGRSESHPPQATSGRLGQETQTPALCPDRIGALPPILFLSQDGNTATGEGYKKMLRGESFVRQ